MHDPAFRRSCRGLLIDDSDRILLLEHRTGGWGSVWVGPGGGVEGGEDLLEALRRELLEETGLRLTPAHAAQLAWVQTAVLPEMHEHGYAGVINFYFLVRVDAFDPPVKSLPTRQDIPMPREYSITDGGR